MDWQPIETAPRDGTKFLGYFAQMKNGVPYCIGWFEPSILNGQVRFMLYGVGEFAPDRVQPTHWQHLPKSPEN